MSKLLIGGALALALSSTALHAAPVRGQSGPAHLAPAQGDLIWLANNGKGNGGGAKKQKSGGNPGKGKPDRGKAGTGKGNGNPGKAKGRAEAGNGKPAHAGGPKGNGTGNADRGRGPKTGEARAAAVDRITTTPAPEGRDMLRVLGASGLSLLTPGLSAAEAPAEELITYSNCPPGLAKKDPPCVPPGLAKKGVTYDEWASYDRDRYDEIWVERRDEWLDLERDADSDAELLLSSDEIARLFDLDRAPEGQRYALIDGLPVLLGEEDYAALRLVNSLARLPDDMAQTRIAPTAALTQNELIRLYGLPPLAEGQNYSVLNGELLQLSDANYEILQLIRIARAVL
ncbi:hypothetical protein [Palleronia abyssalis]|uniref:Uncharacterized protein n=1 Tax=Palleronia abyssalis TaxID=1501240 RepID=A0A2R8BU35_9RHOB|nr:hypothetical protein [Palleronia abyssalis]SPJ23662.1 hypothetical protein PAA8504_01475 [Palleronia abyssalis]